jgi:putative Mg2+ transporter-C (MgtC) family protein
MLQELDFLRELNIWSVMLRLTLAMIFGGLIGLERGKKGRAAGLWASACVGLAIGAGFYEAVLLAFLAIFLSIRILTPVENLIIENARNMNLYVEFESLDDIGAIIAKIKGQGAHIYEVDIDHGRESRGQHHSAVFSSGLQQKKTHARMIAGISELKSVRSINEIM